MITGLLFEEVDRVYFVAEDLLELLEGHDVDLLLVFVLVVVILLVVNLVFLNLSIEAASLLPLLLDVIRAVGFDNRVATDVAASDRPTGRAPDQRVQGTCKTMVVLSLVNGHGFALDALRSEEGRSLGLRIVPGLAEAIVLDIFEITDVTGVCHVVHLAIRLTRPVPVEACRLACLLSIVPGLFVDGKAVFRGGSRHLPHPSTNNDV